MILGKSKDTGLPVSLGLIASKVVIFCQNLRL